MVLALAWLYLRFGGLSWMQGLFYGIGAAVIAIIGRSAYKLTRTTLGKDRLLWTIFFLSALVTAWTESEMVWLFLISGAITLFVRALGPNTAASALAMVPPWLLSGLHGPANDTTLSRLFWYFAEAGAFVFGSGLAIVPFLHAGVVNDYQWLTERQFLDAVAVAMITPGPVVITVAFIGYLVGGPLGATVAALGTFLPCYLFVVLPAPYFRKHSKHILVSAFVSGVTAAATGTIAGAAFILGKRAITDIPTVLIAALTLGILLKLKQVPEPLVIVAGGLVGLLLRG
jgi:chromate transporter